MPSNLLNADTSFPQLSDKQSTDEKMTQVVNYLYMLLEQLRYTLSNLGEDNFNDTELANIGNAITEPVYVQLKDDEANISALQLTAEGLGVRMSDAEGNISQLTLTSNSLTSRMTSAEGSISTLTQTANSLTSRITSAEGSISSLSQTANSLTSRITSAEGSISSLSQTVNSISLSVSNGSYSSTISLLANGVTISSQSISFSGVVTFSDLSTSGWTTINGDNITTGTIEAINITGCTITGSTFRSILSSGGSVGGELEMYYINEYYLAGGIRLDDQGAGTASERRYRMFIYTDYVAGVGFAMKLQSASGISIAANENIYISAGTVCTIDATRINLNGTLYINGTLYTPATTA